MPIYEYQCVSCQHDFEALQKMSDDPLSECPECHKHALRKKISAAGFRLSGSGWYETDFKKSGNKKNLVGNSEKPSGDKAKTSDGETKKAATKASPSTTSKSD